MSDQNILFKLSLDNSDFKQKTTEATQQLNNINKSISDTGTGAETASSGISNLKNGFSLASVAIKGFMGYKVASELYEIGKASIKAAAQMEQQKVAFTTLLGSAEKAQDLLNKLQAFAASTPFQFNEIVDASKKLIAFGFSADQVEGTLRRVGDVASGLNIPLGELVEIYGKARTQNTLYNEDINQLAGRGIPVFEELGKILNVDTAQVKKLSSEGKVTFPMLEQMFKNLTSEGGKFAGMMNAQSQTLSGGWSNLNDQLDKTQLLLGNKILNEAKNVVAVSSNLLSIFNDLLEKQNEQEKAQQQHVSTLEIWNANLNEYGDKLGAIIKRGGENATYAKQYAEYLSGNIRLSEQEVEVIQQKLQLNRDLVTIQTELTQAEKDRQDARHRDAAAFAEAYSKKENKTSKSNVKAKEADQVAYYTAIGNLEQASTTSIQNEQKKQLANAKLMFQQKLITKAQYESSIQQIELNYAKQTADAQDQLRQESIIKDATAWQAKQAAQLAYWRASFGFESKAFQGTQMIAQAGMTLMNEKNKVLFNVGKAATVANIVMSTAEGIMKAWSFGPIIGSIFAAIVGTASALQISKVATQKPPAPAKLSNPSVSLPSFAVGAWNVPSDMTANIHKNEMIIPATFAESIRRGEGAITSGSSAGINIYVQGSVVDSQGLLAIVDDAQKEKASLLGATTYTYKSAYR